MKKTKETVARTETKCCCRFLSARQCAQERHATRSCDDFQRSLDAEEAQYIDWDCECACHDQEDCDEDDYDEING